EITGHYDDGTARDLQLEFDLTFTFAEGNGRRAGTRTVVDNVGLDDTLTVSLDGVDSPPVPLIVVDPQDRSLCPIVATTTAPTPGPPPTRSTTRTTSPPTTTTTPPGASTTTPAPTTTPSPLPPPSEDPACGFCVHDRVQHRFRIANHIRFDREQLIQDRCAAV